MKHCLFFIQNKSDKVDTMNFIMGIDKVENNFFIFFYRLLVWNDVGLGAIMRSNVDGTDRVELARAANASALALDQTSAVVYWAVNRQILCVDLDTLNK